MEQIGATFFCSTDEKCAFFELGGMFIQSRGELAAGRQALSGVCTATPSPSLQDEKRQDAKKYQQEGRP